MFNGAYLDWNHKRIKKIINHFGHQAFFGKTVLDLGCGLADVGGALARLGAQVTAVDVRQEHLNVARKKYPHITALCVDLDRQWPFVNQQFDFVLGLGIFCHLTNYKQVLAKACSSGKTLILESEVCDSIDSERVIQVSEHSSVYDWAINGVGNKPSATHLEQILRDAGMTFKRFDDPALNSGPYRYDWVVSHSHSRKIGYRRFWVANRDEQSSSIAQYKPEPQRILIPITSPSQPLIRPEIIHTAPTVNNQDFKVAVCISGYMRSFEKTFERLNANLLHHTKPDIFIHTWDFIGTHTRSFDAPGAHVSTKGLLDKINHIYKPTKLVIEPAKNFPINGLLQQKNLDRRDINGILSMFYKVAVCNQLKKDHEKQHGFTYDCVIRLRSDLMFMSPFYISKGVDMDHLYVPIGYDYEGINDQVAYGNSDLMDRYSELYNKIEALLRSGEKLNPERLVRAHILNEKLPLERANMHYYIKRGI